MTPEPTGQQLVKRVRRQVSEKRFTGGRGMGRNAFTGPSVMDDRTRAESLVGHDDLGTAPERQIGGFARFGRNHVEDGLGDPRHVQFAKKRAGHRDDAHAEPDAAIAILSFDEIMSAERRDKTRDGALV